VHLAGQHTWVAWGTPHRLWAAACASLRRTINPGGVPPPNNLSSPIFIVTLTCDALRWARNPFSMSRNGLWHGAVFDQPSVLRGHARGAANLHRPPARSQAPCFSTPRRIACAEFGRKGCQLLRSGAERSPGSPLRVGDKDATALAREGSASLAPRAPPSVNRRANGVRAQG
jgi:hypothetical protein